MVKSFRHKGLKELWETGDTRRVRPDLKERAKDRLRAINQARQPGDLNLPGFDFHPLKGQMAGRCAIKVSGAWRMTFAWQQTDAIDVDLEQYH